MKQTRSTTKLARRLGLATLVMFGVGNIVGAGIYVLIGKVAGVAGQSAPLAFVIALVIAGLSALSYTELSSRYPQAAGVSAYTHSAFGSKFLSLGIGLLMLAGGVVSAGVLARGFAGYLAFLWPLPSWLAATMILVALGMVASWGIGQSAKLAVIFTVVELIGLGLVIWAGRQYLSSPVATLSHFAIIDPRFGWSGVLAGAFLAFYAFIGFEDMVSVAEEVKRPRRTMPLGIILSLLISASLYIAVVIVAVSAIPPAELAASSAPLSLVFSRTAGSSALLLSLIGMSAAVNGILAHQIGTTRLLFGLAKRGWLHHQLASVHSTRQTPTAATIITVAAMIMMAVALPIEALARLTSLLLLLIFIFVNAALIAIKRHRARPAHAFIVAAWVPYAGLITSAGLIIYQIIHR